MQHNVTNQHRRRKMKEREIWKTFSFLSNFQLHMDVDCYNEEITHEYKKTNQKIVLCTAQILFTGNTIANSIYLKTDSD